VEEIREIQLQCETVARDIAEPEYYHLIHHSAMPSIFRAAGRESALAFATVLGDMFLQAGDGHGHPNRQLPLLGGRYIAEPNQAPHAVARFEELAFEPSMFRTTYGQGRKEEHKAPVENYEEEDNTKANKKQILFFALVSPLYSAKASRRKSSSCHPAS
jgi:hypothetical protein